MRDDEILIGSLMENSWLTLEQVAAACTVEPGWLRRHIEEGFFRTPRALPASGAFPAAASCARGACGSWNGTSKPCRNWRR
jgi:chaperone modulatory protein CbpM